MKRLFAAALVLSLSVPALAVPSRVAHQGRLSDATGSPLTGSHDLDFALFDAETGGSAVWSESQSVAFDAGFYAVVLGATTPITAGDLADDLWLEITVDGAPVGRLPLNSVPFALRADTATNVSGGVVDASELRVNGTTVVAADGGVDWSAIRNAPVDALTALGCSAGQSVVFDGFDWVCATPGVGAISAEDVVDGVFAVARLPVGTGAGTVASGDHTHDAAAVVTGVFDAARIPALDAAKVASGTLAFARLPVGTTGTTVAAGNHAHDASAIVSGTLDAARLPAISAADVGALAESGGVLTGDILGEGAAFVGLVEGGQFARTCEASVFSASAAGRFSTGTNYNNHCYVKFNTPATYLNAQLSCERIGGYLAEPNTPEENAFINTLNTSATQWIGYTDAVTEGVWTAIRTPVFVRGTDVGRYTNFNAGEPNNSGNEDCAHMYVPGTWNDAVCTSSLPFVCELDF